MERYAWQATIGFVAILAAATAMIVAGRSAELERFALLAAQGAGFIINFYLVLRSNKNTEIRVQNSVDNGVQHAVEQGLESAAQMIKDNTPPPGTVPKVKS
jgi:hypothetical protein